MLSPILFDHIITDGPKWNQECPEGPTGYQLCSEVQSEVFFTFQISHINGIVCGETKRHFVVESLFYSSKQKDFYQKIPKFHILNNCDFEWTRLMLHVSPIYFYSPSDILQHLIARLATVTCFSLKLKTPTAVVRPQVVH